MSQNSEGTGIERALPDRHRMNGHFDLQLQRIQSIYDQVEGLLEIRRIIDQHQQIHVTFRRGIATSTRAVQNGPLVMLSQSLLKEARNTISETFDLHRIQYSFASSASGISSARRGDSQ